MSTRVFKVTYIYAGLLSLLLFICCPLVTSAAVIKGEEITDAVRSHIEDNFPWADGEMRVEFSGGASDVNLGGEEVSYRVQAKRNEDYIGNTSFTVRFYEDGIFLGEQTVRVRLELLMDVVVSTGYLRRNAEVGPGDVKVIKQWLDRVPRNIVSSEEDVVGKKLRSSVKPNAEIKVNMLTDIPMVLKGKPVKIVADKGLMGMTTVGVSEQDGLCGELVKVRNISSGKMIYARVMDKNMVIVEF